MCPATIPIKIMFIAESPPKLGNGFFYDDIYINSRFREKLFSLINKSNLGPVNTLKEFNNKAYYLADAINCRWDKKKKKTLSKKVFTNCSVFLFKQIELLKPKNIIAMGNRAHQSLAYKNISSLISDLNCHVIKISFILTASNETDEQRIAKLRTISSRDI